MEPELFRLADVPLRAAAFFAEVFLVVLLPALLPALFRFAAAVFALAFLAPPFAAVFDRVVFRPPPLEAFRRAVPPDDFDRVAMMSSS